jgi:ABC-type sulfate transport system permease component
MQRGIFHNEKRPFCTITLTITFFIFLLFLFLLLFFTILKSVQPDFEQFFLKKNQNQNF